MSRKTGQKHNADGTSGPFQTTVARVEIVSATGDSVPVEEHVSLFLPSNGHGLSTYSEDSYQSCELDGTQSTTGNDVITLPMQWFNSVV